MSKEEAITILQDEIKHIEHMIYPSDMETTMWVANRIEAIKIAVTVLEKQIPKKVEVKKTNYFTTGELEMGECPCCGADLKLNDNLGDNYCCECGQKLEW